MGKELGPSKSSVSDTSINIEASIDPSFILVVDICFQICMLLEKHKVMQVYERCIILVLYIELSDLHEGASLACYSDRCSVLSV